MDTTAARVAILLCTHNGVRFLREQLESIKIQSFTGWTIYASDDMSTDQTPAILRDFDRENPGRIQWRTGPGKGYVSNFLSLVDDRAILADYYAFCDQDDVWMPHHLKRALTDLTIFPCDTPALHCARTVIINERGERLGKSPQFSRPPSFRNALVQNIAGGNTMVFNAATRRILNLTPVPPVAHDWWTYQVVSGVGGKVIYSATPSVLYRQHGSNLSGSNRTWSARVARAKMLFTGVFARRLDQNIEALSAIRPLLSSENERTLNAVICLRKESLVRRFILYKRCGLYRQTAIGNVALDVAAILNLF